MLLWLIPLILLVASTVVLGVILARKIPQLRVMETSTASDERSKRVKEAIILERVGRMQSERLQGVARAFGRLGQGVVRLGRLAVQRLYKMEQYYQKLRHVPGSADASVGPEAIKQMLEAAEAFARADEPIQAEKKYIEVISHSPKCSEAYEGLGNLYLEVKQYEQAREALAFALRLSRRTALAPVAPDAARGRLYVHSQAPSTFLRIRHR